MRLTQTKLTRRGQIALYADGQFLLSMHPDVFAASGFSVGDEIDEEQLRELSEQAQVKKAKEKALSLLSRQAYTSSRLTAKLRQTLPEQAAVEAVGRMEELGLVDDAAYACRYARELYERKLFGVLRIRQELRKRGISQEMIDGALAQLQDCPERQIARVIERKYPAAYEDEQVRRRAAAALLRMGYRPSDIRRVLRGEEFEYGDWYDGEDG